MYELLVWFTQIFTKTVLTVGLNAQSVTSWRLNIKKHHCWGWNAHIAVGSAKANTPLLLSSTLGTLWLRSPWWTSAPHQESMLMFVMKKHLPPPRIWVPSLSSQEQGSVVCVYLHRWGSVIVFQKCCLKGIKKTLACCEFKCMLGHEDIRSVLYGGRKIKCLQCFVQTC